MHVRMHVHACMYVYRYMIYIYNYIYTPYNYLIQYVHIYSYSWQSKVGVLSLDGVKIILFLVWT